MIVFMGIVHFWMPRLKGFAASPWAVHRLDLGRLYLPWCCTNHKAIACPALAPIMPTLATLPQLCLRSGWPRAVRVQEWNEAPLKLTECLLPWDSVWEGKEDRSETTPVQRRQPAGRTSPCQDLATVKELRRTRKAALKDFCHTGRILLFQNRYYPTEASHTGRMLPYLNWYA